MNKLEELKKKYEELGKEIERLEKCNKRWRADEYEMYYRVNDGSEVVYYYEHNDCIDDFLYKTRNYFKTEKEAEEYSEKINTYYDLMDLAEELNNGEEIDWKNTNQIKWCIVNYSGKVIELSAIYETQDIGQIYCLNENFLDIAKEQIGEDRLIKLFKGDKR